MSNWLQDVSLQKLSDLRNCLSLKIKYFYMTTGTYRTFLNEGFDSQQDDHMFLEDLSLLNQYSKSGFGADSSP